MLESTSDIALFDQFTKGVQAYHPLGDSDKLTNPDFAVPFSIIIGGHFDWVRLLDEDDDNLPAE